MWRDHITKDINLSLFTSAWLIYHPFVISNGSLSRGKAISAISSTRDFSIAVSLAHIPFWEFIRGEEARIGEGRGGGALQKQQPLSIHHPGHRQVSQLWQRLPPSPSALLSLRIILTMHNNHTDWGSCLSWTASGLSHVHQYRGWGWLAPQHAEDHTEPICFRQSLGCHSRGRYHFQSKQVRRNKSRNNSISPVCVVHNCVLIHHIVIRRCSGPDYYDIIKEVIRVPVVVEQHVLKLQHRMFNAISNIISIWSMILYSIIYLTWNTAICQNKDCCCSAC